ncbi:MAG: hypothetical protein JO256_06370 [Alphaproteobacteria bacterium]|nr:hypothetical protein [Alphaproteobacteria bacterium]
MLSSTPFRDRLPSAAATLGVQAGFLALLLLSFNAVRRAVDEKETFLILPPLARPLLLRPVVIDARGAPKPKGAAPPPAAQSATPPAFAAPPVLALPVAPGAPSPAPGQAWADCTRPDSACPPTAPGTKTNPNEIPFYPEKPVKNAPIWQSEIERRNTPPRVPCVSLTHEVVGMGGFQQENNGARLDITCALKQWRDPALLPPVRGTPVADPGPQHAPDDSFRKALQAVNARKQVLSGRPAAAGAAP